MEEGAVRKEEQCGKKERCRKNERCRKKQCSSVGRRAV